MTQSNLTRIVRRLALLVFAAAVGLLALSLIGRPPALAPSALAAAPDVKGKGAKDNYDLSQLEIFRKVVVYIKDNYVDPKRIDPKEMFVSALEAIEKSTAEVLVEGSAKDGKVKITCGAQTKEFEFKDVESIWMIPHRIRPIFAFIQDNLVTTENKRDIEYSAINGMLTTLDPHSWLLKPDLYREMKLQTKGEFGGLGFVISMDEERLTVKKVLKNTPASRAGIKKGDHISRIEDESTINMDLNEAVSKLRGKPGTEVKIFVKREKDEEKQYRLTRDLISIESVTSQMLDGNVGYVRLSSFAGTTARDLASAVRELKSEAAAKGGKDGAKLKGLVLDLRANPGGLLEQAIQVTDQFVEEGTIVTTAGMSDKLREPKFARNDGGEREFPIAVLVNSESASASEIVAGALKNLNRAVIVGRQSFGKGSVQVLYDLPEPGTKEESALKLTIAQYLTPGDLSIQEIGVTPDIELVPARVSKERVDLFAPPRLLREADLDKHFGNGFQPTDPKKEVQPSDQPTERLRYLREEKEKVAKNQKATELLRDKKDGSDEDDAEAAGTEEPDEDAISQDYQVQFARDLVLRAPKTDRLAMLQAAKPFLAEKRQEEEAKIQKSIETLGLDWSVSKKQDKGPVAAVTDFKVTPPKPAAGEQLTLTVTVQNNGKVPFERLRAYTKCDAEKTQYQAFCQLLDRREFLFGKVSPGEKRSWSTQVKVPNHLPATHEILSLIWQEANNNVPEMQKVEVDSTETPKPAFAFTFQVLDQDGLAEPGETVDVQVDVKNIGTGRSSKNTYVSLRNQGNERIFMKKGRVSVGPLAPGESKSAVLTMEVRPGANSQPPEPGSKPEAGLPLKVEIGDRDMWEFTTGKIYLPSLPQAPAFTAQAGQVRVEKDTLVTAAPTASAAALAEARKGAVLPQLGKAGEWAKVEWSKGRVGFVPLADVAADSSKLPKERVSDPKVTATMQREPPLIAFNGVDTAKGAVVVDGERFKLSGSALDTAGLSDVRIFVDNEKVFFRSAKQGEGAEALKAGGKVNKLNFNAEFPLKVGNNMVLVVAREDDDFSSQRTLVIHRRAPAIAERKTGDQPAAPRP